jgi:acetyl esterase
MLKPILPMRLISVFSGLNERVLITRTETARKGIIGASRAAGVRPAVPVSEMEFAGPGGTIRALHYRPDVLPAVDRMPILIYFHGGGWVVGAPESADSTCRLLALHAGVQVLSVDYRMAPEHPYPAAFDDCLAAYDYVVAHADSLGIDPQRIALGGDSAGGNLTATVALATRDRDIKPAYALMFYPVTDIAEEHPSRREFANHYFLTNGMMRWFADHYAPAEVDRADPYVSPLHADDVSGMPPSYVATAGFDPLRDEGQAFADRLAAAGVPVVKRHYPRFIHGFANFTRKGLGGKDAVVEAAGALRVGLAL